jgi:hypothetical protein
MQAQFWKIRQHIKVGVEVWEQLMRLGRIACASSRALGVTLLKGVAYSSRLKAAPQAQRTVAFVTLKVRVRKGGQWVIGAKNSKSLSSGMES